MAKILTVVGATGIQGGSVVAAALKDKIYKVRGITRNVNSDAAKALKAKGVEVVAADVNDVDSIVKAFEGSTAIYALTNFFEPFLTADAEEAIKVEELQGTNLAKAALKTMSLEHYVWSTLPDTKRITDGEIEVPHFAAKSRVNTFIKKHEELAKKTTLFFVASYASNILSPVFKPIEVPAANLNIQLHPVGPSTPHTLLGSPTNIGLFVLAVLHQPSLTLSPSTPAVLAATEILSYAKYLELWGKVAGKRTAYVQTTLGDTEKVWGKWASEIGAMSLFWEKAGSRAWEASGGERTIGRVELGLRVKGEEGANVDAEEGMLVGTEEVWRGMEW
ncbi:NmrA-like family protein-like protein [Aulographum hederae CBS 113979]|uniref:NmrA-like family protein-like protein n=1 Tax=Aulographum hederae CBS 113979 TaxID=1176131 RepID=A0A6G1HFI3_9PEZI|nr:NmrA-like family protein-like protein [Aulographum hederae CBS 113979]